MARRPILDPTRGPVARFAQELRALRDRAGSTAPSVDLISETSGIPRSTLYAALRGTRVPRVAVLIALTQAWGGDEGVWLARRTRLHDELVDVPVWRDVREVECECGDVDHVVHVVVDDGRNGGVWVRLTTTRIGL